MRFLVLLAFLTVACVAAPVAEPVANAAPLAHADPAYETAPEPEACCL